ncbi:hypothetical protein FHX82_002621 [Amycolatopsis bartoniae]|uniref:hypothetical protein n=1 Tax=Amycolatopsis bartoniae TaxID=941986 RepID=UPI001197D017|nr:hypothetical protein [Amycolatopsis bartoniae]MBB2935567.1 hypothetical protein [Amycolatopsis bartoniae]TVT05248.1 hypothetical protein FNH07_23135 [Amycolatopsis bartoniae]
MIDQAAELSTFVAGFSASLSSHAPYRPPTPGERDDVAAAVLAFVAGRSFSPGGFATAEYGRYAVLVHERGWGLYAVDRGAPPGLAVQVPHPNSDLHTEKVGVAVFTRTPSVLLVAGAHRKAGRGAADVAHREDSVFHAVATGLALPQVQLHGFQDAALPGAEVVVSPGAGAPGPAVRALAAELADAGFATRRAWADDCRRLAGTRNRQGRAAARLGTVFAHVEVNRTVREDPTRRVELARVVSRISSA